MTSSRFVTNAREGRVERRRGFREISLNPDDLVDEFFRARAESEDDDDKAVLPHLEDSRGRLRFPAPSEKGSGGRRISTARYARGNNARWYVHDRAVS